MTAERRHRRTYLFTVRLWFEPGAQNHTRLRGQVRYVLTGEAIYFRKWLELVSFFEDSLEKLELTESVQEQDRRD